MPQNERKRPNHFRTFAVAVSLAASVGFLAGASRAETGTDPAQSRREELSHVRSQIADARSALSHSPAVVIILCNGKACLPVLTPETYPYTARARTILEDSNRRLSGYPKISARLFHVLDSLPQLPRTSGEIQLCDDSKAELQEAENAIESATAAPPNPQKNEMLAGFALSLCALLFSLSGKRKEEKP